MARQYGSVGDRLREIASESTRRDESLERLAFCFDRYLEFVRDGHEATEHMDATKATKQLEAAVSDVLGYPPDTAL